MTETANGILAHVRGQDIARGSMQLPTPGPALLAHRQSVLLDVPDLGSVRITYEASTYRHGKSRHWHWVAVRADRAGDA